MIKKYIQWKPKKRNENCYEHPNTNNRVELETDCETVLTESCYKDINGNYMSFIEYPDYITEDVKIKYLELDPDFKFKFIEESEVNALMLESYGINGEGEQYVSVNNFVWSNNIPII